MFNLIKMNFYRLFHQKSFYVMIAVAAFIGWFMVFMIWMTPRLEEKAQDARNAREQTSQTGEEAESNAGFHVGIMVGGTEGEELPVPQSGEFNLAEFVDEFFTSGFTMILISVGAALIANSERKRGFIKNLGGQMKPRGMLIVSKLPVILFELVALYAAIILSFTLFGRIYYDRFTAGNIPVMCKVVLVQLLLGLAFGALVMLVCTAARNAAAGIFAGIVVASGLFPYVYFFINRLATAYLGAPAGFDISKCSLDYYLSCITSEAAGKDVATALIVGVVYLLLASAAGCLVLEKRDIG
ncbi:MAG: ABC transporter permease subunit [Acetatifactor sp.]|nr:ABC transporter permease subunit [Acetatifactor sp.]